MHADQVEMLWDELLPAGARALPEDLAQLAAMLADGGAAISDLATLHDQSALFGDVASVSTAWRTLEAIGPGQFEAIARARPEVRAPASAADADPGRYVLNFDATRVRSPWAWGCNTRSAEIEARR